MTHAVESFANWTIFKNEQKLRPRTVTPGPESITLAGETLQQNVFFCSHRNSSLSLPLKESNAQ